MEKEQELQDDDRAVFVPVEDIRSIERALNKMEQVKQEFYKVAKDFGMIDNGKWRGQGADN